MIRRLGWLTCVSVCVAAVSPAANAEPYYVLPEQSNNNATLDVHFSASGYLKLVLFDEGGLLDWLNPKSTAHAAVYAHKTAPSTISGTLDASESGGQLTISAMDLNLLNDGPASITAGTDIHVDALNPAVRLLLDTFLGTYINQIDPNIIDPNIIWGVVDTLTGGFDFQKDLTGTLSALNLEKIADPVVTTLDSGGNYSNLLMLANVDSTIQFNGGSPIDLPAVPMPFTLHGTYTGDPVGAFSMASNASDANIATPNVVLWDQVIELPIGEGGINVKFHIHLQIDDGYAGYSLAPELYAISGYLLTTNVTPTGKGTIDVSPAGPKFAPGTEVTLTANPIAGWMFDHWEGAVTGYDNPVTLTMDTHKNVTAVFVREYFWLTLYTEGSGYVPFIGDATYDPNTGATRAKIESNTSVTFNPTPSAGWAFDHWTGDIPAGHEMDNPLELLMDGPKTITAIFEKQTTKPCGASGALPLAATLVGCCLMVLMRRRG